MSRQGSPLGGRNNIAIQRIYIDGAALTLIAYTNAQDSLGDTTVTANLTQPTVANGYAPIVLSNGSAWSKASGVAAYTHPAGPNADNFGRPCWFCTGTWSAPVTGVALILGSDVLHYFDHRDVNGDPATFVAAAGKRMPVDIANLLA